MAGLRRPRARATRYEFCFGDPWRRSSILGPLVLNRCFEFRVCPPCHKMSQIPCVRRACRRCEGNSFGLASGPAGLFWFNKLSPSTRLGRTITSTRNALTCRLSPSLLGSGGENTSFLTMWRLCSRSWRVSHTGVADAWTALRAWQTDHRQWRERWRVGRPMPGFAPKRLPCPAALLPVDDNLRLTANGVFRA